MSNAGFAFLARCIYPHAIMIRLRSIARALLLLGFLASSAIASPAPLPPPAPGSNQNTPAAWIGMLLMFIIVAAIIGISMMPSRRGHQD
jgi:hypothetical protein